MVATFPFAGLTRTPIELSATLPPILFVVVDTEEEFDWNAPFSRDAVAIRAIRALPGIHRLIRRYGILPTYVVDYAVATQEAGYAPIKSWADAGECTVGAHLHPWNTPPFTEELSARNTFAGNLDPRLEEAKIRTVTDAIGNTLGVTPRVYKAGRYGFGASTARTLERLGFDIDLSINPGWDYADLGGPSFVAFEPSPFAFGNDRQLLELPCTSGCIGAAGRIGPALRRVASKPALGALHAVGLLARLRIADRLMLSPEGYTLAELRRLTLALMARGLRTFTLSFHSPSAEPGHTPYVQSQRELDRFLATLEAYFEFFFGALGGTTMTPGVFWASVSARAGAPAFQGSAAT